MSDLMNIKKDFPIFKTHPNLVYLDNASTTQTPGVVLEAMNEYYATYRANIHRGVYELSGQATDMYEGARQVVATLLNAAFEEIVFTSGTTQALNALAYSLSKTLKPGDNIVLTRLEHHANLIPWQEMSRQYGFEIRFIEISQSRQRPDTKYQDDTFMLDMGSAEKVIDEHTKIVSFALVSNTLGTINQFEEIIPLAKKVDALTIVDAAQALPHMPTDMKRMDCDFLVFSGHKMYGPTGIGVLYGKREQLEKLDPFFFGGDMIKEVSFEKAVWNDIPWKFEAGTPNIAGAIGLAAAIQWLERIGSPQIIAHEATLMGYAIEALQKIPGVKIIGPAERRVGVISFTVEGVHPHDIATILDKEYHIAVRAGHHCTMPLIQYLGIQGTVRASLGIYNTKEDVDALVKGIERVKEIFHI